MPLYGYKCTSCEHVFEEIKKVSEYDAPCKEPCPECSKTTVQRYIDSAPALSKTGGRTNLRVTDDFNSILKKIDKFYGKSSKGSTVQTN